MITRDFFFLHDSLLDSKCFIVLDLTFSFIDFYIFIHIAFYVFFLFYVIYS